ncbi:hypothetical protein SAMN03159306_05572 [Pseudomonas sp. NFACC48-1]|nr:hypothetical protein SAMN03159424_04665 [Pseudomonas sp. NFACC05-1]SCZ46798.1 hypothetical protein SAMN03159405_05790 [Pseudomonas sp. NFACC44-2]SDA90126.1 hypothetical protein SAMN03159429_05725 [Pseudomonas sp. NFACC51]SDB61249.1 hypothetical protein SAMN03159386_04912 [Pseudomonas sp. NFACC17-2]SDY46104.1 hypothetical protein SAMN03159474_05503 [Pseudomonas sp. NFACC08-1]SEJ87291.1 hypothetical protein SAMN03159382_04934 [Pseudomonas sp. NFACC23-1]SEJ97536.1 hypothetical protein SAMN031
MKLSMNGIRDIKVALCRSTLKVGLAQNGGALCGATFDNGQRC